MMHSMKSIIDPIKKEMIKMKPTHIIDHAGTLRTWNGVMVMDGDTAESFFITKDLELEPGEQVVWGSMIYKCVDYAVLDFDVIANRMVVSK